MSFIFKYAITCYLSINAAQTSLSSPKNMKDDLDFVQNISKGVQIKVDEDLLARLDSVRYFHELAEILHLLKSPNVSSSIEENGNEISSLVREKRTEKPLELDQAVCFPTPQTVSLDLPKEDGVIYFPTCVRLDSCGGCCFLSYHSCQPIKTEKVLLKVYRITKRPKSSRRRSRSTDEILGLDYINLEVEKHVDCTCKCKLQESECNATIHTFDQFSCTCNCLNRDDENKCFDSNDHYWDNDNCRCLCRRTSPCSTGFEFDHETCTYVRSGYATI